MLNQESCGPLNQMLSREGGYREKYNEVSYYAILMPNLIKLAYILLLIDLFAAPMRNCCDRENIWRFLRVYLFLARLHANQWFPECSVPAYLYDCIPVCTYVSIYVCIYVCVCVCVCMDIALASPWTVGWIFFMFAIQEFINFWSLSGESEHPFPKMGVFTWAPRQKNAILSKMALTTFIQINSFMGPTSLNKSTTAYFEPG
jgi:hypothetical protein